MTRQESTALLREARQGSREALGELYARYGGRLLAFIRMRMGRDLRARVESRDILQATLLKSFQRLDAVRGRRRRVADGLAGADRRERDPRPGRTSSTGSAATSPAGVSLDRRRRRRSSRPASGRRSARPCVSEEAERLERRARGARPRPPRGHRAPQARRTELQGGAARMGRSEDACRMLLARAMVALTLAAEGRAMSDAIEAPVRAVGRASRPARRANSTPRRSVRRPAGPAAGAASALIARYRRRVRVARRRAVGPAARRRARRPRRCPRSTGFRTIERLGAGGMGEVYKLHDLKLDRLVAAKVLRGDGAARVRARRLPRRGPRAGALPGPAHRADPRVPRPGGRRRCSSWSTSTGSSWAAWRRRSSSRSARAS